MVKVIVEVGGHVSQVNVAVFAAVPVGQPTPQVLVVESRYVPTLQPVQALFSGPVQVAHAGSHSAQIVDEGCK